MKFGIRREGQTGFGPLIALVLLSQAAAVHAQSAAEYSTWLNWCRQQNGIPNGDPNNPVCTPGDRGGGSSGLTATQQGMLGLAGAIGSAIGNSIRESIEAEQRRAGMVRMQQAWEEERARLFAASERERLSREMTEHNNELMARLKGGVQLPNLAPTTVGTTQLKLKTRDEMLAAPASKPAADATAIWNVYLAALKQRDEAAARLASATDQSAHAQTILDAAQHQQSAASGDATAADLVRRALELNQQAIAELRAAKQAADGADQALDIAARAATGIEPPFDGKPVGTLAIANDVSEMINTDPMVVDARRSGVLPPNLPRLEEVENSPGRDAWVRGMEAAAQHNWPLAATMFGQAKQSDPDNAALARAVDLAVWTRDHRGLQDASLRAPRDEDLKLLFDPPATEGQPYPPELATRREDVELNAKAFTPAPVLATQPEDRELTDDAFRQGQQTEDELLGRISKSYDEIMTEHLVAEIPAASPPASEIASARLALADELARQSLVRLQARDLSGAIALLDDAARQAPDVPNYAATRDALRGFQALRNERSVAGPRQPLTNDSQPEVSN